MRILVVTDDHPKSPSGINTTITNTAGSLEKLGHKLFVFYNRKFFGTMGKFDAFYKRIRPDAIHILTERAVGRVARKYCITHRIPFTTAFLTNYEGIIRRKVRYFPTSLIWKYLRWFHSSSEKIHVTTPRLKNLLKTKGFTREIAIYPHGIDFQKFYYSPSAKSLAGFPRPYFMTMSRIIPEKNIEAFLKLDLPGTKFVIGEGRAKEELMKRWGKEAIFLPYENVAEVLSQGDVFVCPSKFETFGLVMIEAMASGLPIAAFPVMGPKDVIRHGVTGFMNSDLKKAALDCLQLHKADCIGAAKKYSWDGHTKALLNHLILLPKR